MKTILERLDELPPFIVRAMAITKFHRGKKSKRLPRSEIVRRSKLPRRSIDRYSYSKSWAKMSVEVASRFAEACGVDIFDRRKFYFFVRDHVKNGLPFLTKAQKRKFDQLVRELRAEKQFNELKKRK